MVARILVWMSRYLVAPWRLAGMEGEGTGTPLWETVGHQGGAPQNTWSLCGGEGETNNFIFYKETLKKKKEVDFKE